VDLIRDAGIAVVKGNCEACLADRLDECGCGFKGGTACDLLSQQWYAYTDTHLTDESWNWMGSLPELIDITIGDRLWHNSGVIGMPANDGTPRVWYLVLTPTKDGVSISHHALNYDHAAAARMRAEPLPAGYAHCLETGLWRSLDVLPGQEKAATGGALQEHDVSWSASALMPAS
jgi:hypothetical protein